MPFKNGQSWRLASPSRRLAIALLALVMVPALANFSVSPSEAATARHASLPDAPPPTRVKLAKARTVRPVKERAPYAHFDPSRHAAMPTAGTTTVQVSKASRARAASSPITLSAPTRGVAPGEVRVTTADQKTAAAAGVHGVLFSLQPTEGAGDIGVDVDATTFRNAYGGDFAARLHLVRLPACALSTPQKPTCRTSTPIVTGATTPLSAQVAVASTGPTVLAATSTVSGPTGDYTATSLSPGGSWSVGGNSGAFTYSYPIGLPAGISQTAPTLSLNYTSASLDAHTEGTNNQSSWLGDGWSSTENYIERTYKACEDVSGSGAPDHDRDNCWAGQILTMSLNGTSTAIVYDAVAKTFRPVGDSANIKIENVPGAVNGTKNGEFFRVTENGVQYNFGLNRLPGWSSGKAETQSVYTMPVYRAHGAVSDCPDGAFADTACTLGYRFNLDYVVDTNDNAIAYYYAPDTGYYGANMKDTAVEYDRGGSLKRIDYGLTSSTIYSAAAPAQVSFITNERCIVGRPAGNTCADGDFTVQHPEYWPDTPVDLNCTRGSTNCTNHGPSFWSRLRLTSIVTQVQVDGAPQKVDRYDFVQSFPDGGDHAPTLWLASISHTGLDRLGGATGDVASPAVTFDPVQIANRKGTLPGLPLMYHNRIRVITDETGAETDVEYGTPDCSGVPASNTADPSDTKAQEFASTNTTGCFPVYWTPEGQPRPLMDWFYTHPVSKVTTLDNHNSYQDGTQPKLITEYAYRGNPGWHYDDNEVVKEKNRTWGQFRGYPEVDITTGDPNVFHYTDHAQVHDQKTLTKSYYLLGMNGDVLPGNKTRPARNLTSQDGTVSVADANALAGQLFESDTYTGAGAGATIDSATVTVPTIIGPTASRVRSGLPALTAQMVRTAKTLNRRAVSYGWRKTENDFFYDTTLGQSTTGLLVQSDDRGEVGAAGNVAHCTFTRYLDGATPTLILTAETLQTDQDCSTAGASPTGNLLADLRNSFDRNAFGYNGDGQSTPPRPTAGNVTLVQKASAATDATATTFINDSVTAYDSYGRVVSTTRTPDSKAADGTTSLAQTSYIKRSPASGAQPKTVTTTVQVTPGFDCSAVTTSSKNCQLAEVTMDAARSLPIAQVDISRKLTSMTYDALGRLTAVWRPNRNKQNGAGASVLYSYAQSKVAPTVVMTRHLLDYDEVGAPDAYATSEVLYDAMMRPLETQATGENGSVTVSDTQYDSHGWPVLTNNAYSVAGSPVTSLISDHLSQVSIPQTTVTDHDAMGRATQVTEEHNGGKTRSTRTAYTGDKTTVLPPTGGVATTTVADARGQTTRLDHYTAAPTLTGSAVQGFTASGGSSQSITYEYTNSGKQAKVTGPDNSVWSYGYDLLGRQTSHTDPDTGGSVIKYDDADNVIAARGARGFQLDYTYDLLGRRLTASDRVNSRFKYASWTYDTLQIGKLTSSSRFVPNVTGSYTVSVIGYSILGNPLGQQVTLPTVEQPLPLGYTTRFAYTLNNEQLALQTDPAVFNMSSEVITYNQDRLGAPTRTSGNSLYVSGTTYNDFGQPSRITMGSSADQAEALFSYDEETLRLTGRQVYRSEGIGPLVDDTSFTYDDAGNPLTTLDKQSETGNIVTDAQCFRYDGLARLVDAWTAAANCPPVGTGPTAATVSNKTGSYWQSYAYDTVGDRTQLVDHSTIGGANVTTNYTNGCTADCNRTGPQPHTLTATNGGVDPTKLVYDVAGNLLTRTPTAAPGQTLRWDNEDHLTEVTTAGATPKVTKYLYDADGNQLMRREPGRTTLFVGDTEIVINTAVTPAAPLGAVRTYQHGGTTVAVHSTLPGGGTAYLLSDPHGTSTLAMNTNNQAVSRQQYKPYGDPRSTANVLGWPDLTHGFLGKSLEPTTGYTDLGARKYDPVLGRFISADPVLELTDPNQLGGYTYAGDNPISRSDPSGLIPEDCLTTSECYGYSPTHGCPGGCGTNENVRWGKANGVGKSGGGGNKHNSAPKQIPSYTITASTRGNGGIKGAQLMQHATADSLWRINGNVYDSEHLLSQLTCSAGAAAQDYQLCEAGAGFLTNELFPAGDHPCGYGKDAGNCNYATTMSAEVGLITLGEASLGKGRFTASCDSFDGATEVLMADGGSKPISEVKLGDHVVATDPETGKTSIRPVTATHLNQDTDFTDLTVRMPHGRTAVLHTTQRHLFWDATRHQWIPASKLATGDHLKTPGKSRSTVGHVRSFVGDHPMYNLTVDKIHTYYVLAANIPVLVHNTGPCEPGTALRPVGSALESVNDIMANPQLLKGRTPAQVEAVIGSTPGWRIETLGKGSRAGQGWVFRRYNDRGNPTGEQLRWHPGGGHHGSDPYWRVKGPNGDLGGVIYQ